MSLLGKYVCVYRLMADKVYIYHIAHGASNYPALFRELQTSKELEE